MTRGRHHYTAHLVAETIDEARAQWVDVFSRDRADLGPDHAAQTAAEDIDRYGPQAPPSATERDAPPHAVRATHPNLPHSGCLRPSPHPHPMTRSGEISRL